MPQGNVYTLKLHQDGLSQEPDHWSLLITYGKEMSKRFKLTNDAGHKVIRDLIKGITGKEFSKLVIEESKYGVTMINLNLVTSMHISELPSIEHSRR